ncbi:MAG: preprotein translocase subunit SecG [Planctomycetes bacterium]|nr:preprotein translocase subunit SecG [Planctomycetota bacterium]
MTCIALILIILVQKGKGGGLSSAFGGGMSGGVLGSKTGDFLTWVTISLVAFFLLLAVVMAKFYKPSVEDMARNAEQQASQDVNGAPDATPLDTNAAPTTTPAPLETGDAPVTPEANEG